MKKFNKIALLSIAAISTINNQTTANQAKITGAIVASVAKKSIEQQMLECAEKHMPNFADLTISNIKSKIKHIECLRKELLDLIQKADKIERNKYSKLEAILYSFNVNEVFRSIQDFKEILAKLPQDTSKFIKTNLNDPMAKRILGF